MTKITKNIGFFCAVLALTIFATNTARAESCITRLVLAADAEVKKAVPMMDKILAYTSTKDSDGKHCSSNIKGVDSKVYFGRFLLVSTMDKIHGNKPNRGNCLSTKPLRAVLLGELPNGCPKMKVNVVDKDGKVKEKELDPINVIKALEETNQLLQDEQTFEGAKQGIKDGWKSGVCGNTDAMNLAIDQFNPLRAMVPRGLKILRELQTCLESEEIQRQAAEEGEKDHCKAKAQKAQCPI